MGSIWLKQYSWCVSHWSSSLVPTYHPDYKFPDLTPLDRKGPHSCKRLWGLSVVLPDGRARPGSRSDASAKNFTTRLVYKVFVENLCDSNFLTPYSLYLYSNKDCFNILELWSAWLDRLRLLWVVHSRHFEFYADNNMWLSRRWKQYRYCRLKSQTWQRRLSLWHNTANSHRAVRVRWANCTGPWTLSYPVLDAYLFERVGLCVWFLARTYRLFNACYEHGVF